jgi:hypothetical protein
MHHVVVQSSVVSEKHNASIFRVQKPKRRPLLVMNALFNSFLIQRNSSKVGTASTLWSGTQGLEGTRFASIPAVIKFHPSKSTPQYHHEYLFSGNLPG